MSVRVVLDNAAYYKGADFELRQGQVATLTDGQWAAVPSAVKVLCESQASVYDPSGSGAFSLEIEAATNVVDGFLHAVDFELPQGLYSMEAVITAYDFDGVTPGRQAGQICFDIQSFTTATSEAALDVAPNTPDVARSQPAYAVQNWLKDHPISEEIEPAPVITHQHALYSAGWVRALVNVMEDFDGNSDIYAGADHPSATWTITFVRL